MTLLVPENKIYLTAKARMVAEAKLKRTALILHILLGWYSFCLIVLSLGNLTKTYTIPYADLLSTALSIGLFALSFFVYGERYHERADKFRSCYLKLQSLHSSNLTTPKKMAAYAAILDQYDNHTNSDYDDMLFDAWMRNQELRNAAGPVSISLTGGAIVCLRRILRALALAALFAAPVIVAANFSTMPSASVGARQSQTE